MDWHAVHALHLSLASMYQFEIFQQAFHFYLIQKWFSKFFYHLRLRFVNTFYFFLDAETSLAEAAVLAQHEQQYTEETEEKHDEEKRSRQSSTSSAISHASSTSSKNSSTKGYPAEKEELLGDDEGRPQPHNTNHL